MINIRRSLIPNLITFCMFFFALFSFGQDLGITKVAVVGASETNPDEYSFCPTNPVSLDITVTNYADSGDNISLSLIHI